ncbi:hypothetical protein H6501_00830 [Candidatus Woesearchaeota archaeon]|nr:hypothetical protein [Nanoarchaeota archaeon]MCB9370121.1 hypothetical protein [Candidatus Woesearchaeota archaeon]USN44651.1 MAG: hypothetical protein H6500_02305 [Candidatus Woesearchaeota archaeon]
MEIINDKVNTLLGRRELTVRVESTGPTLTRGAIKEQLVKKLDEEAASIFVKKINTNYRSQDVLVEAYVYESEEALKKSFPAHLQKRNESKKAAGGEE